MWPRSKNCRANTPESPVVQDLRRQVANAFILYANYKHYHWQTYGPHFRDLHKLFDKLAEEVLETLDPLAERVRMIGPDPPAHPLEMADLASVALAAPGSTMRDMVEEADRNAIIVVREMRHAASVADGHGDPGTVDLLLKARSGAQKARMVAPRHASDRRWSVHVAEGTAPRAMNGEFIIFGERPIRLSRRRLRAHPAYGSAARPLSVSPTAS